MIKRFFAVLLASVFVVQSGIYSVFAAGVNGSVNFQIEKTKDAIFVVDDKPAVDISITIPSDSEDRFDIKLITDDDVTEIVHIDNNGGNPQELHLEFAVSNEGYHKLRAELLRNGVLYHDYEFEQYYIRTVTNDAYTQRGFCVHYEQGKGSLHDAEMLKASGTPVVRDGISWSSTEQVKGQYNFAKSDAFIPLLAEYGIEPLLVVDSYKTGHDLYLDENGNRLIRSDEQIEAFSNFVMAAVRRYPQIKKWEILNEPNFVLTGAEYYRIIYTTAKKIKAYDPTLEVYAGGLAVYDNKNFINGFYLEKLYPYIDGISYHHYNHWRYADGPEYYRTTDEIVDIMMREGGWKNLIITETGYSTGIYNEQVPEIKEASDNVKRAVTCDWYGIDYLAYYDFKDDGYDATEREHNFGSVEIDNTPKPGYYTVKQYQKATNRAIYIGEAYLSDAITAHVYAANDDYFMIAWAKNPNPEADIRKENTTKAIYSFGDENVTIENMFGEHVGGNTLTATYQPSYIHGLSSVFCLSAIAANRDHDLFGNVRDMANNYGYSTQDIENRYGMMCQSADFNDAVLYLESCYGLAELVVDDYLYGGLDMSEAAFSNLLSEIERICENGLRMAVLFDDTGAAAGQVYTRYENLSLSPAQAVEKNVAYINEPYYKGKYILNKIARYNSQDRVLPQSESAYDLKSDNTMTIKGTSLQADVLVRIDNANGTPVYLNLIPTDGNGYYYFTLSPNMPFGEYIVTVDNGTVLSSPLHYAQADDYLSIEDKMTTLVTMQADRLLNLYERMLDWADIKHRYYNPKIEPLVWSETQWINVTGKIERMSWADYSDVILTAYDKDTNELRYIDSIFPNGEGEFRFSFKYEGDPSKLYIRINQGGVLVDNASIEAVAENRLITGKMYVTEETNTTDVLLQIQNYFKLTDQTVQIMIGYYDSDKRLIACLTADAESIGRDETMMNYSFDKVDNVAIIKVFAWDNTDSLKPHTDSVTIVK